MYIKVYQFKKSFRNIVAFDIRCYSLLTMPIMFRNQGFNVSFLNIEVTGAQKNGFKRAIRKGNL